MQRATLPSPDHRPASSPLRRVACALAPLLAVVLLCSACLTPQEQLVFDLVNFSRGERNLPPLDNDPFLNEKAENWAERMAAVGTISHSNLADGVPPGWQLLGENVGSGTSPQQIHEALLNSPPHYKTMMGDQYNYVGIGTATGADGRIYLTQIFMRR